MFLLMNFGGWHGFSYAQPVQNCLPTHNNQINKLNHEKKALP